MRQLSKRYVAWMLALTCLWVCTAGFIRFDSKMDVHADGTMDFEAKMLVHKKLKKNLDVMQANLKKQNPNLEFKKINDGVYAGYSVRTRSASYVASSGGFISSYNGTASVQKQEGWFSDTYAIDIVFPENEKLKKELLKYALVRRYPPKYKITISLPCSADYHNADKSMNDDKVLSWDMSRSIIGNSGELKVTFTLWHKQRIVIAGCVGAGMLLAFLSLTVAVFRSGSRPREPEPVVLDDGFIDRQFKTMEDSSPAFQVGRNRDDRSFEQPGFRPGTGMRDRRMTVLRDDYDRQ